MVQLPLKDVSHLQTSLFGWRSRNSPQGEYFIDQEKYCHTEFLRKLHKCFFNNTFDSLIELQDMESIDEYVVLAHLRAPLTTLGH